MESPRLNTVRGGGGLGYGVAKLGGIQKAAEHSCVLSDDARGSSVHRSLQFIKLFHAFPGWWSLSDCAHHKGQGLGETGSSFYMEPLQNIGV